MIKISEDKFKDYEQNYPGITEQIQRHDAAELPACPHCASTDTAKVIGALVGRTIHLAAATTKVHLTPNGSSEGAYHCNACKSYFDAVPQHAVVEKVVSAKKFLSRPRDCSWQAYRDWVLSVTNAITGKEASDKHTEDEWKLFAAEFWAKR